MQKLDEFANEVLLNVLERSGHCGVIASEEIEEAILSTDPRTASTSSSSTRSTARATSTRTSASAPSSASSAAREPTLSRRRARDALRPGREIVAAGYVLYGPSTIFVLSTGTASHGFTLDPTIGEFFLSHRTSAARRAARRYSINEGNYSRWTAEVQNWARWIKERRTRPRRAAPYGARYVGSLVADAHRTLIKGGIFAYPADTKSKNGKLRLLYEANPMAFLFEQAGGGATNGTERILDIMPDGAPPARAARHRLARRRRRVRAVHARRAVQRSTSRGR